MNELLFVSTKDDPIMSFQEGIDEGHEGLNQALNLVIKNMPPALFKIVAEDLDRLEKSEPTSSLTTEVFSNAIRLYQDTQLLSMIDSKPVRAS
ncbi:hypothetical protein [Roseovarius sp. EL26]|uniref:hypothetical protein n=1 Tax=Roseovarius sp. EL26 TaxID=2126672 RepID=UPI0013C4FB19|nr:hypothetical protein [Roseovarius sp. EL26]